jgi:hypothetical protein
MDTILPTTLVGSYPQPDWLIDRGKLAGRFPPRVRAQELWRVAPEWLEQAQDDTTLLAIRDQEGAGLDIITDGEMRPAHCAYCDHAHFLVLDRVKNRGKRVQQRPLGERPCHNLCPVTSMVIMRAAATTKVVMAIVRKILSIMTEPPSLLGGPRRWEAALGHHRRVDSRASSKTRRAPGMTSPNTNPKMAKR